MLGRHFSGQFRVMGFRLRGLLGCVRTLCRSSSGVLGFGA